MKIKRILVAALILVIVVMIASRGCRGLRGRGRHIKHLARDAVVIPAGTYHNAINKSRRAQMKLYTIYSPPNHPDNTVHKIKAEADAAEAAEHHS